MLYSVTKCPEFTKGSSLSKCQTVSRYARKCNFMLGSKKCGLPAPIFTTYKKTQQHYMYVGRLVSNANSEIFHCVHYLSAAPRIWQRNEMHQNAPKSDNKCEKYGYKFIYATKHDFYCADFHEVLTNTHIIVFEINLALNCSRIRWNE
jgi:hypothetical protein